MTTDEELMLEFRQGSREAFEEIFQRHREALYGFFRRRLHDASRAGGLAQETFLAVIRGVARYEPRALVRTYLYGIALNLLAAERRKRSRDGASPEASVTHPWTPIPTLRSGCGRLWKGSMPASAKS
jgi:DNA-directed RNA polymerase specialized sigma24 family protein